MQLQQFSNNILPTKSNISILAGHIVQDVIEGFEDPLKVVVVLEGIKSICEEARKGITSYVIEELDKYQDQQVARLDAKIEPFQSGIKYDFSRDVIWQRISDKIKPLQEELKAREAFLKSLKKMTIETDPDSGETFEVYPPGKTSTSSFKIILAK
ncbi:hypothetical protein [Chitinophaga nivalis]|uniref:Uncharacterized protein n=1 Tax=Chitinophaga nivalis TaxID=2991709 RepID=A0ABT3IIJ3_9BACT|nr:hypothetical protein [Chitinophaga nivalis]MCW3466527.1 hypothetical protein [Chitinophaga nivalis]MCW3483782.1 hypothetical protein [Chitinophaga nivalis]